jgi:hypothetical protein
MADVITKQSNAGAATIVYIIRLAIFVSFTTLENIIDSLIVLQLLGIGQNYVHEAAHSVYLMHVYNNAVEKTFPVDDLFGADITILIEDRVYNTIKRVHKLSTTTKLANGQTGRGGSSTNKRGGSCRRRGKSYNGGTQQYGRQREYDYDNRPSAPPTFGRYYGGASSS